VNAPPDLQFVGIEVLAAQPNGAAVGRVDEADEASAVLLGKRVLVPPTDPCGQCDVCRRGGAPVCPLAKRREHGKRLRASTRWLVTLDDGIDLPVPAAAAVAGDVTLAYTMYARTGIAAREPAVVVGTTPVARFLVEILIAKGVTPIVLAEPPFAAWVLGKGAVAVAPSDDAFAAVTSAIAAQGIGSRPWRIFATADSDLAAGLAGPRSTLTVLAPASALPARVIANEVTIIGVAGPHPDLIVETAAMCVKGEIDLAGGVQTSPGDPTRALVTI
jgi:6-hydroxycyclohex-1-ene-1-carbonyl-CoA dehydrogenase